MVAGPRVRCRAGRVNLKPVYRKLNRNPVRKREGWDCELRCARAKAGHARSCGSRKTSLGRMMQSPPIAQHGPRMITCYHRVILKQDAALVVATDFRI